MWFHWSCLARRILHESVKERDVGTALRLRKSVTRTARARTQQIPETGCGPQSAAWESLKRQPYDVCTSFSQPLSSPFFISLASFYFIYFGVVRELRLNPCRQSCGWDQDQASPLFSKGLESWNRHLFLFVFLYFLSIYCCLFVLIGLKTFSFRVSHY